MTHLPANLKYADSHEWARLEDGNIVWVGITDFAQQQLGDLVYIGLPEIGRKLNAGEQCAVVESVKTASDLFSPVAGEISAVNSEIADNLEKVNDDPYNAWLFCIKSDDLSGLDNLMDAETYQRKIED